MISTVAAVLAAVLCVATRAMPSDNPYQTHPNIYINPDYVDSVNISIAKHPDLASVMQPMKSFPSFFWIDKIAKLDELPKLLGDARKKNATLQIVVYDLPNRDCAALASNGELTVKDDGLNKYKTLYIDRMAKILNEYTDVPVIMVIEPDSLPNLVTNLQIDKCKEAEPAYREGVPYAMTKLAGPKRYQYIDAAHECWLGWTNNMQGFQKVIGDIVQSTKDTTSLRGFATNVANYQCLHAYSSDRDCGGSNPIKDEQQYIEALENTMSSVLYGAHFIIDTGRDGAHNIRQDPGNWCNIHNAGVGARPHVNGDGSITAVDAFVWVKPPGESDGTSDPSAPNYDAHCGSVDSLPNAPQAGQWFDDGFVMLVKNANPPLKA